MIIGMVGFAGSGKSTVGDILVSEYGFQKIAFADPLKDAVSVMFGWDRSLLEGDTKESREFRETVDPWWSDRFGHDVTPRGMLKLMGTEAGRDVFDKDLWIHAVDRRIDPKKDYVITDVRFPNEIRFIGRKNGYTVRVKRGPEPEWFDFAAAANTNERDADNVMMTTYSHIHISEWAWIGSKFSHVIENEGTMEDLKKKVENMMKTFTYKENADMMLVNRY